MRMIIPFALLFAFSVVSAAPSQELVEEVANENEVLIREKREMGNGEGGEYQGSNVMVNIDVDVDSVGKPEVDIDVDIDIKCDGDEKPDEGEYHWCYTNPKCAPDTWPDHFATCGGTQQSPIDIIPADAKGSEDWPDFTFVGYNTAADSMEILNNGHTATVTGEFSTTPEVFNGYLHGGFQFLQMHWHWGSNDNKGSEHTVNGIAYPLELHLVHYNNKYADINEAIKYDDGLAVLGIFYTIGAADNPAMQPIIDGLANIKPYYEKASITPFALETLLPADTSKFWRYWGSLTTPTCNEVVEWTVFENTIEISASQLEAFREILDVHGDPIVDNYRPVQPLDGREVKKGLDEKWGYVTPDIVPANWADKYSICGEDSQSPIDIVTSTAEGDYDYGPWNFKHYGATATKASVKNNGHSVTTTYEGYTDVPSMIGGDLGGEYTFAQWHVHWGPDDNTGSEHTVDGTAYPAEIHLVHYKTEYGSLGNAIAQSDGLAVLGIFVEIGSENADLTDYFNAVSGASYAYTEDTFTAFPLEKLLPSDRTQFWRYSGSLTTPTCNEIVTWTVFKETLKLSAAQVAIWRTTKDYYNNPIMTNFRPVQPLNGRKVYHGSDAAYWGYVAPHDDTEWATDYAMCGLNSQSPIDIVTSSAVGKVSVPFSFNDYGTGAYTWDMYNNGHSVALSLKSGSTPSISGGDLGDTYDFAQFHFHWGPNDASGSEHTIDSSMFPLELHLVHFKASYGDIGTAITHADGLAVLGILYEISPADNPALDTIIAALNDVVAAGTHTDVFLVNLENLLPTNRDDYYRYTGSLTTPTCNEVVTWTVFNEKVTISSSQVAEFRKLMDKTGHAITINYRSVQPLNGRTVNYFN